MKKKDVILFQPFLRVHILNFSQAMKNFQFVVKSVRFATTKNFYKRSMSSPEKEFSRSKIGWKNKLRRIFGILNVRMKFTLKGDMLFTYGCLLLTNKPYCTYIENGAALFNYDPITLKNPLAQFWFLLLIRLPQCKKLIFMSDTAKKSLLATGQFSEATEKIIEQKSVRIYPFVKAPTNIVPKKYTGSLKLLFTGVYYAKGGRELVNAFKKLSKNYPNIFLTIVTPLHMLLPEDRKNIKSIPEISILDAAFDPEEMENLYRTHDIFMFPTFRDTFGLVLIEAISFGMPIIATDQYAVSEMALPGYNALIFSHHPLLDYDPDTKEMYGKLYDAKTFYNALFTAEKEGKMHDIETFLFQSVSKFLDSPELLEQFSKNSLKLYEQKFDENKISDQIESVFLSATQK